MAQKFVFDAPEEAKVPTVSAKRDSASGSQVRLSLSVPSIFLQGE